MFNEAVIHAETRLKAIVEFRLFQIAEGAAKQNSLQVKSGSDVNWLEFIKEAQTNPDKFEILKSYYSRQRRLGLEPEPIVVTWMCDYLDGNVKMPKKEKGAPKKLGGGNFILLSLIETLHQEYSLKISRNEVSPKKSACDALSVAINKVNMGLSQANRIYPSSYNKLRELYYREKRQASKI